MPDDAPSNTPTEPPHPLQAQLDNPRITLDHAMDLVIFKAMQFAAHLERHGVRLPEIDNVTSRVREAQFWMNEAANLLSAASTNQPKIIVPSHLDPLVQQ